MSSAYTRLWLGDTARRRRTVARRALRGGTGLITALALVWILYKAIFPAHLLGLGHVKISGAGHVSSSDIEEMFKQALGQNLFTFDPEPGLKGLLRHPWIQEAQIRKILPDTLLIQIVERSPAAVLETPKGLYWVDSSGIVLGPAKKGSHLLPRVVGISLDGLMRGHPEQRKGLQIAMALIRVVQDGRESRGLDPIVVDLSHGSKDPRLFLEGYYLRFGEGEYKEKWGRFLAIRQDMKNRGLAPEEIDLRFVDQVVVKTF
jgi:cell division protein FtsQ